MPIYKCLNITNFANGSHHINQTRLVYSILANTIFLSAIPDHSQSCIDLILILYDPELYCIHQSYLRTGTLSDICDTSKTLHDLTQASLAERLAAHMRSPTGQYLFLALHVLRYLAGIQSQGKNYTTKNSVPLKCTVCSSPIAWVT